MPVDPAVGNAQLTINDFTQQLTQAQDENQVIVYRDGHLVLLGPDERATVHERMAAIDRLKITMLDQWGKDVADITWQRLDELTQSTASLNAKALRKVLIDGQMNYVAMQLENEAVPESWHITAKHAVKLPDNFADNLMDFVFRNTQDKPTSEETESVAKALQSSILIETNHSAFLKEKLEGISQETESERKELLARRCKNLRDFDRLMDRAEEKLASRCRKLARVNLAGFAVMASRCSSLAEEEAGVVQLERLAVIAEAAKKGASGHILAQSPAAPLLATSRNWV